MKGDVIVTHITEIIFLQHRKDGEWTTFTDVEPRHIKSTQYDCLISHYSGVADAIRIDGIEENTPLRLERNLISGDEITKRYKEFTSWMIQKNNDLCFLKVKDSKPEYTE